MHSYFLQRCIHRQTAITCNVSNQRKEPSYWCTNHFVFKCALPVWNQSTFHECHTTGATLSYDMSLAIFCIMEVHQDIPKYYMHEHCKKRWQPWMLLYQLDIQARENIYLQYSNTHNFRLCNFFAYWSKHVPIMFSTPLIILHRDGQ
jgi:hypothetical protein